VGNATNVMGNGTDWGGCDILSHPYDCAWQIAIKVIYCWSCLHTGRSVHGPVCLSHTGQ